MSSENSLPATLAEVNVERTPEKSADTATREISPARPGAIWDSTPICVPREPMFPKPCAVLAKHDLRLSKNCRTYAAGIGSDQLGTAAHVHIGLILG